MLTQIVNQYYPEVSRIAYEVDTWLLQTEKDVKKVVNTVDNFIYGPESFFSKLGGLEKTINKVYDTATQILGRTEQTFDNIKKTNYQTTNIPAYKGNFTSNVKTMKKHVNKKLVDILSGVSTYNDGGKTRKAWSWEDRKNQLETYFENSKPSGEEVEHAKKVVKKHGYLSKKRAKLQKEVQDILDAYQQ